MEKSTRTSFLGGSVHLPTMTGYLFFEQTKKKRRYHLTPSTWISVKKDSAFGYGVNGFVFFYLSFLKKFLGRAIEGVMFF